MRIIERGQIPEEKVFQHRCTNCATLFEFKRAEAKNSPDPRDGDLLYIECPLCKRKCWITP